MRGDRERGWRQANHNTPDQVEATDAIDAAFQLQP